MDHDDWRVTISFPDPEQAHQAKELFSGHELPEDARQQLGHSIAVGAGDTEIFLYAGTEVAAREAERIARDVLTQHHFSAAFAVHRWHPIEERWEEPDVAMPRTEADREAEHQRLLDDEADEARAAGVAQWLVRADLPSRHAAVALDRKLRGQGRSVIRRWKLLTVGARDEDDARELAGQITRAAPANATIRTEHSPVYLPFAGF